MQSLQSTAVCIHRPTVPEGSPGQTFFGQSPGYQKLARAFRQLVDDPGLGVLTADAGVGKTAAIRNVCAQLPRPDDLVLYLCDTAVAPLHLYRTVATELGVRPSHRRTLLWTDLKKALVHLVDERGTTPIIVVDEAQHLSDPFLIDLSGFLNFAFDSRDLLTLWLVGLPPLARHLRIQQHAPLAMRVVHQIHLEPLDRDLFRALLDHSFKAVGATQTILADPARELLFRASRGVPRVASTLLRRALLEAHKRNQILHRRAHDGRGHRRRAVGAGAGRMMPGDDVLPVVRAAELDDPEAARRWLVTALWARAGVGIIGGTPTTTT